MCFGGGGGGGYAQPAPPSAGAIAMQEAQIDSLRAQTAAAGEASNRANARADALQAKEDKRDKRLNMARKDREKRADRQITEGRTRFASLTSGKRVDPLKVASGSAVPLVVKAQGASA